MLYMCVIHVYTVQPPPPPPPQPYGCTAVGLGPNSLSCLDLSLLLLYIVFLAGLVWAALYWRVFASFAKGHEASGSDRAPLLNGDDGLDGRGEAEGGEEQMYSYLEQRLRPMFYQLVRFAVALDIMCAVRSRQRYTCDRRGFNMTACSLLVFDEFIECGNLLASTLHQ